MLHTGHEIDDIKGMEFDTNQEKALKMYKYFEEWTMAINIIGDESCCQWWGLLEGQMDIYEVLMT